MMRNIATSLFILFLLFLCGCRKDKFRDFDRMVLNNKVLEREIIKYRGRSDQYPFYNGITQKPDFTFVKSGLSYFFCLQAYS